MNAKSDDHPTGLIPVTKWNDHYEWPTENGLRYLIFHSHINGFARAIRRVGRRVLIDPEKFWEIVEEQNAQNC